MCAPAAGERLAGEEGWTATFVDEDDVPRVAHVARGGALRDNFAEGADHQVHREHQVRTVVQICRRRRRVEAAALGHPDLQVPEVPTADRPGRVDHELERLLNRGARLDEATVDAPLALRVRALEVD